MTPTFAQFVTARLGALRTYAHVLCADAELAAGLVDEALIRTGLAWSRVLRDGDPERYVRATVVALYLSRWTPRHDGSAGPAGAARKVSRSARRRRTVLVLRRVDGLADAEVARLVGRSERWVRAVAGAPATQAAPAAKIGSRSPGGSGHTRRLWATSK